MKKIIILLCVTALTLNCVPAFVFSAYAGAVTIPAYEPWKGLQMAAVGSCNECDKNNTFEYNTYLRNKQRADEEKSWSSPRVSYSNLDLDNLDGFDYVMIGVVSTIGAMFILSLFGSEEYTKI